MKKLLLSAAALSALLSMPAAMADNSDKPRQHDTDKPGRAEKPAADTMRAPHAMQGPRDLSGPGMRDSDKTVVKQGNNGKTVVRESDGDRTVVRDRNGDNRTVVKQGGNDRTVIKDRNGDKTVVKDTDRGGNSGKTVVRKKVDRDVVLKFRGNLRAPHRFRAPKVYVRPSGWYNHRWVFGERLPRAFFAPQYFILNFGLYGLMPPWPGYEWVRYGNDALLIDVDTGEVIRVEYDLFY